MIALECTLNRGEVSQESGPACNVRAIPQDRALAYPRTRRGGRAAPVRPGPIEGEVQRSHVVGASPVNRGCITSVPYPKNVRAYVAHNVTPIPISAHLLCAVGGILDSMVTARDPGPGAGAAAPEDPGGIVGTGPRRVRPAWGPAPDMLLPGTYVPRGGAAYTWSAAALVAGQRR